MPPLLFYLQCGSRFLLLNQRLLNVQMSFARPILVFFWLLVPIGTWPIICVSNDDVDDDGVELN